jgi:predicted dinucleotide-binding enzyme
MLATKGEINMRLGILGSGLMGGKLGTPFARAGHEVVFSYGRSEQKLKRLAREAQGTRGLAHRVTPRAKQKPSCWPSTGPESTTC